MTEAARVKNLPPFIFSLIRQKIEEKKAQGLDIINLATGDPDRPTPAHIVDKLVEQGQKSENHHYPILTAKGMPEFREAVAKWYASLHNIYDLDPEKEVVSLIGSKEGIFHVSSCYVNPGDINLMTDPVYPAFDIGTQLAGGSSYFLPLTKENNFLPDLEAIPQDIAKRAKILFLNYPNNPTGAIATSEFFQKVVEFARNYSIIVCHDAAYTELTFDGYRAPSFLEVEGAKEVGIELGSLSKTYNMTGWRVGWVAGRSDVVEAVCRLKSNVDSGIFMAVQQAAIAALTGPQDSVAEMRHIYQERRDFVVARMRSMGWNVASPQGAFYIWAPVPQGYSSMEFTDLVLEKGVVIAPGSGFGKHGEGYIRIGLTAEKDRLGEALNRMQEAIG
jgi:LL-diaminopimelate aminotransferase